MNNDTSIRRVYIKAVVNGFVVEINDQNFNETVYVFTDWNDAVNCVRDNPPVFKPFEPVELQPAINSINI